MFVLHLQALPARSSEVGGRLTIPGVTAADSGEYTCTVIGIPGSYRAIAVVSVQEGKQGRNSGSAMNLKKRTEAIQWKKTLNERTLLSCLCTRKINVNLLTYLF